MEVTPGATPPSTVPPATPPASPATPPVATPPVAGESVTLTKAEHDQLQKDAARAGNNQRKADLYDRTVGKGKTHFSPSAPATPPTSEELAEQGKAEDEKASRGLMALAADPAFRTALDADPTIRDLLIKNPLAVLPILAPEALDAEDAITLVKDALIQRSKPATPPTPPATPTPPTPPAGGGNAPGADVPNAEYEAAKKLPNTESAIAGMIKAKTK